MARDIRSVVSMALSRTSYRSVTDSVVLRFASFIIHLRIYVAVKIITVSPQHKHVHARAL